MSKWELLRSNLHGKRDTSSQSSIHRFKGFQLINKKCIIWASGYHFELPLNQLLEYHQRNELLSAFEAICCTHFQAIDCTEFVFQANLQASEHLDLLTRLFHAYNDESGTNRDIITLDVTSGMDLITNYVNSTEAIELKSTVLFRMRHRKFTPTFRFCKFHQYTCSSLLLQHPITIFTREQIEQTKTTAAGLLSNKLHGVDNTGNICVWSSESLMLYLLLNSPRLHAYIKGKHVLELGGGLTALCGLGLAISGVCQSVVTTDGHPDCVLNQCVSVELCRQRDLLPSITSSSSIRSSVLLWKKGQSLDDIKPHSSSDSSNSTCHFDTVIACDCLFFKDYHDDLIWVLHAALEGHDGIDTHRADRKALLLQPRRSGTMELFIQKASRVFHIEVLEEYDDQVVSMRDQYRSDPTSLYSEDIHYPVLLILTLL